MEEIKMTYRDLKNQIKEQQKDLAQKIKEQKGRRKQEPDGYVYGLDHNRWNYRHTHILYCNFFNGTPYDKIERTCHDNPDSWKLDNLRKDWEGQLDEALRDCA
jgi:hypothetical protein